MKILLIFPRYPNTFWSYKYALKFISKKASSPPLGLLTVAAMLPESWDKKLVDMNVVSLKDKDLKWADYVFISAISIQKESVKSVIHKCKHQNVKIVAGGPLFTAGHEEFEEVDHFVLNEAENTLPFLIEDLQNGCAKHIYSSTEFPDIRNIPVPLYSILNMKKYALMSIQYSRGCPFDCEFCDITVLYGNKVRTKSKSQILNELENLYSLNWRGNVFMVDDNFIGNKMVLKKVILPAIITWMKNKKYPFSFNTEASINLSDDNELMKLMVRAGFDSVFVGIETPNEDSLTECSKVQNKNRDLIASVKKMQRFGLQVDGGFIVGFDNDPPTIFKRQIEFIQKSGIITAMVGLLNAPRNTKLYKRLVIENRLIKNISGDNTDFSINFIPKMNYNTLINGYREIIRGIYSQKPFYERAKFFLEEFKRRKKSPFRIQFNHLLAFLKSIWFIGIYENGRMYYWRLIIWCLFKRPQLFLLAITYTIYGFHYRKIFWRYL